MSDRTTLADCFVQSWREHPDRPALTVGDDQRSYAALGRLAVGIARTLDEHGAGPRVGVLGDRTVAAYASVLGIVLSGRAYVALNPRFPPSRNQRIAQLSGIDHVLVDDAGDAPGLDWLQASSSVRRIGVALQPGHPGQPGSPESRSEAIVTASGERRELTAAGAPPPDPPAISADEIAYVMFTSGTTGDPKGVPISHRSAVGYVERVLAMSDVNCNDRMSQTFDLTFDLSVHDLFVTWSVGADLRVLPERAVMAPARFIRDNDVTVWFSVPSTIGFMRRLRMLKPDSFPSLRISWFCGEALPVQAARDWQRAAPNTYVENLYGPTEATIAFTAYRWRGDEDEATLPGALVPIGRPMRGLETVIVDDAGALAKAGEIGELWLGGDQLSPGYWNDRERTAAAFVEATFPGREARRWYRTGDLARAEPDGEVRYIGRLDSQVKILGYRVELTEIERVVRAALGTELVAVVPWPLEGASAGGVVAFVGHDDGDVARAIAACERELPKYMVPKSVRVVEPMPLNANGKIDRPKLRGILEDEDH